MKLTRFLFVFLVSGSVAFSQTEGSSTQKVSKQSAGMSYDLSEKPGYNGKRFGAGLMLGEPLGVSLKYWIGEKSAIDGGIGLSFNDGDNFHLHADYLYHIPEIIAIDEGEFLLYFGGGPRFKVRNNKDDIFGVRAVAGLTYVFENHPVDTFVEAGPVFDVTPDFKVRFMGAIGARYWF